MYCPTCGADLPNGTAVCTNCGTPLAPQADYVETYNPQPAAKPRFSVLRLISLLLTLVCIGLLITSYFVVMNTSIEDIAFISFVGEVSGEGLDEFEDAKDSLEESHRRLEIEIDPYLDDLDSKDEKKVEKCMDDLENLSDSLSLNNANAFLASAKELAESDLVEEYDLEIPVDKIEDISGVLNTVSIVVLFFMLFCLAFCAFGGFFRINGLVIPGLVFSVIYGLIFTGFVFPLLFLACNIALCIFNSKSKNQEQAAAY